MQKRDYYTEQLNSIEINFFEENNFFIDEYEILIMKDLEIKENKIKIKFESTLKELIYFYNDKKIQGN